MLDWLEYRRERWPNFRCDSMNRYVLTAFGNRPEGELARTSFFVVNVRAGRLSWAGQRRGRRAAGFSWRSSSALGLTVDQRAVGGT